MECSTCHQRLSLGGPDRESRVAYLEDGVGLCHRCAIDVTRSAADDSFDGGTEAEPVALAMAA
jgi:hypothetical protein